MDMIEELCRLIDEGGLTVKFGLEAQGHIPTIRAMLDEGEDWPAIGKSIGWHWPTAKEYWERYCDKQQDPAQP